MKIYNIPVSWIVSATMKIEAGNLAEAIEKANEAPLPEGNYVDGSFEITRESLRYVNKELSKAELKLCFEEI